MRTGVIVDVFSADRERLAAIAADRNNPQKHAWRAWIVLLTGEGCGTAEIMREAGVVSGGEKARVPERDRFPMIGE